MDEDGAFMQIVQHVFAAVIYCCDGLMLNSGLVLTRFMFFIVVIFYLPFYLPCSAVEFGGSPTFVSLVLNFGGLFSVYFLPE